MQADELIDRVKGYSWKGSFLRLASLAATVANEPGGPDSERVRQLTVDPIAELTGGSFSGNLLANGRAALRSRRNEIIVAHEEAISLLQHLVILEGGDDDEGDAPGDPEIGLWLAGANGHLARWAEDRLVLPENERLAAEMVRISRYNGMPDPLRALVRAYRIFGRKPSTGSLSDETRWNQLAARAYPGGFEETFETGLGLVALMAGTWGSREGPDGHPVMNLRQLLATSRHTPESFIASLTGFIGTREEIRAATRKRMAPNGLPHSPTALYHTPLVQFEPTVFAAASPWAVTGLLKTGIWAQFLRASKARDPGGGATEWLSAFGYMFEDWCRDIAREAAGSLERRATILLPSSPGAADEVEDVVILDEDVAVFCSAKGRLVEAKIAREAVSPASVITWMEKFLFENRGDDYRGGVLRQLSARIDKLRRGEFEDRGLSRSMKVIPLVVSYDSLGESDVLYRSIEAGCLRNDLLQQPNVGPLALARIQEFEQLLSRVARGKGISALLSSREGPNRYRRLDQILYEAEPPCPPRLRLFETEANLLTERIRVRAFGEQGNPGTSRC
jgi:hypothetical protein